VELQLSIELLKLSKSGHFYFGETGHFYFGVTKIASHKRFYVKWINLALKGNGFYL
jgi:hypothetical protein